MTDNDKSNATVSGYVPLYDHENDAYVSQSTAPVCVSYRVGLDAEFTTLADAGTVYTSSDIDYTVKVKHSNEIGLAELLRPVLGRSPALEAVYSLLYVQISYHVISYLRNTKTISSISANPQDIAL